MADMSGAPLLKPGSRIFYADVAEGRLVRMTIASEAIRAARFTPYAYIGVSAHTANLRPEIEEDFTKAEAILLYVGKESVDPDANWAFTNLRTAIARGVPCMIFAGSDWPNLQLRRNLVVEPVVVHNDEEFRTALKSKLRQLAGERH